MKRCSMMTFYCAVRLHFLSGHWILLVADISIKYKAVCETKGLEDFQYLFLLFINYFTFYDKVIYIHINGR